MVNVPTKHHPTSEDISSPTDIWFGDVQKIPKKGHLPTPAECVVMFVSSVDTWKILEICVFLLFESVCCVFYPCLSLSLSLHLCARFFVTMWDSVCLCLIMTKYVQK